MKKICSLIIAGIMVLLLAACTTQNISNETSDVQSNSVTTLEESNVNYQVLEAVNLMEGIKSNISEAIPDPSKAGAVKAADFAVKLFKACNESGMNTLISPLSVLAALSMTANGAKGETAAQMEKVLGMSIQELNEFYLSYSNALVNGEKYKLNLANSIWFTSDERFTVNRDFLQKNANYFKSDIYKAPFDDTTLEDINDWVYQKTDGMISDILDEIPAEAIMYLINALAFDAEWQEKYTTDQIGKGNFVLEDGTKKNVEFMSSIEYDYLSDDLAQGFMKYYNGGKYAFVAMLPNEGVTVDQYVSSLSGEKLQKMISNAKGSVSVKIPKFETEYDTEMSDILKNMGMTDAFSGLKADFTGLGTSTVGNIFIGRVIHKTYISVTETGTRAGAATVVEMRDESFHEASKSVIFNRPFVYMIVDTETNIPFFIGTLMDVGK